MANQAWKQNIRREHSAAEIEKRLRTAYANPTQQPCPTCGRPTIRVEIDDPRMADIMFTLEPATWDGEYVYRPKTGWRYVGNLLGTHTEHRCNR